MKKLYVEGFDKDGEHIDALGEKWRTAHFVYADGKLENEAGYDIVGYSNDDVFDFRNDRVEDVIAVLPSGEEMESILFFWHDLPEMMENITYTIASYRMMKRDPVCRCHGRLVAKEDKERLIVNKKLMEQAQRENKKNLSDLETFLKSKNSSIKEIL